MQSYRAILYLLLLLNGSTTYANSLLHSDALPLRLRRLSPELAQHRSKVTIFPNFNNTNLEPEILSYSKSTIVARAADARVADATTTTAPSFNEAGFNQSATTACAAALGNYTEAINPSGLVACYNVAAWDNSTGVFQTDVRLYQKSPATGSFAGMVPSNFSMSFSIEMATLSNPMAMTTNSSITANTPAEGQFVMGFQNIGQLTSSLTYSKLSEADLRVLMIPSISLGANTGSGSVANTSLASDTLSYVAGELVQANGTATNITAPQAASQASPIVAAASVFVLPGTQIMIAPVGLIITCIWSGLLMLAVGAGTIRRYQYRMQFRQRVKETMVGGNKI